MTAISCSPELNNEGKRRESLIILTRLSAEMRCRSGRRPGSSHLGAEQRHPASLVPFDGLKDEDKCEAENPFNIAHTLQKYYEARVNSQ